jgi:hypothetical protein
LARRIEVIDHARAEIEMRAAGADYHVGVVEQPAKRVRVALRALGDGCVAPKAFGLFEGLQVQRRLDPQMQLSGQEARVLQLQSGQRPSVVGRAGQQPADVNRPAAPQQRVGQVDDESLGPAVRRLELPGDILLLAIRD